jgi:hypothetical protein
LSDPRGCGAYKAVRATLQNLENLTWIPLDRATLSSGRNPLNGALHRGDEWQVRERTAGACHRRHCSSPLRALRRAALRLAAVLACFGLWMSSASAGPGVIVASRVEAFDAPSRAASVVSTLGRGAPVCILDEANYPGVLHRRPGWFAIRLPGGVGYVPMEAVDLAAPASEVRDCRASVSASDAQAQGPALAPDVPVASMTDLQLPPVGHESEPAPEVVPSALIAGGFLPLRPVRFQMGVGSGMAWLNKQVAGGNHIGDSSPTLNGTLGLTIYDVFMVSGSGSVAFPSDYDSFSQDVVLEMGGGDAHTAGSSLSVTSLSIAAGLRTPFWALGSTRNGRVAGALFAQYGSATVSGNRSISDCGDCRVDKIDMPGGTFWHVGFDLLVPSHSPRYSYGLTVAYQHYEASAGFSDELRAVLNLWL